MLQQGCRFWGIWQTFPKFAIIYTRKSFYQEDQKQTNNQAGLLTCKESVLKTLKKKHQFQSGKKKQI